MMGIESIKAFYVHSHVYSNMSIATQHKISHLYSNMSTTTQNKSSYFYPNMSTATQPKTSYLYSNISTTTHQWGITRISDANLSISGGLGQNHIKS